jgi:hypothetical protein
MINESDYLNGVYNYSGGGLNNPHDWLMHVLAHEVGHLLSLFHPSTDNPACDDLCVMYDQGSMNSNQNLNAQRTFYVTDHDVRALIKKWGL